MAPSVCAFWLATKAAAFPKPPVSELRQLIMLCSARAGVARELAGGAEAWVWRSGPVKAGLQAIAV